MAKLTRRKLLLLGGGAVAACGVGGAAYCFGVEPVWLRTIRIEVTLPGLAPAFDGFRIAQISDLHVGCGVPRWLVEDAVLRANEAVPDLVALTGDFVHRGGGSGLEVEAAAMLGDLVAREGVVGVLGNHDAGVYRREPARDLSKARKVQGALEARQVEVLVNRRIDLERDGARFAIAGLGDLWSGEFDPQAVELDAKTLVLSHNPDTAPELATRGAGLILSGHTHGGQVSIPFLGPPILPIRHREFAAGHYRLGDRQLYVNRGVGWLRRVRLFVRPEVTILTLRAPGLSRDP